MEKKVTTISENAVGWYVENIEHVLECSVFRTKSEARKAASQAGFTHTLERGKVRAIPPADRYRGTRYSPVQ